MTTPPPLAAADMKELRRGGAIKRALGLFESCIKSGENWSLSCAQAANDAHVELASLLAEREAREGRIERLEKALTVAIAVAEEARIEWDRSKDMRAGKLLIALSDPSLNYRHDISMIHAVMKERGRIALAEASHGK